jgi:hypothetical protein
VTKESNMDRDVSERAMRIVGQLQCLSEAAKHVEVMPCDKRTAELMDTVRHLSNKAALAAWEYAEDIIKLEAERAADRAQSTSKGVE